MNPLLSPPAPSTGPEQSSEQEHGAGEQASQADAPAQSNGALSASPDATDAGQSSAQEPVCAHCGAPLQEGQHWCLNCGAATPGSLGERPNWRPLVALALAATLLVAGAAVATAAALDKSKTAPRPTTLAQVPATTATPPTTAAIPTTPGAVGGTGGSKSAGSGSAKNLLFPPTTTTKPPKIPVPAATPEPSPTNESGSGSAGSSNESTGSGKSNKTSSEKKSSATGTSTTESTKSKEETSAEESEHPNSILLDTNAATTYNPYNYPEAGFGDPALAIDGEPSTAWTAQIQPASFPKMAEGLLIDLRSPTKLGSIEIRTPDPGMTVQVFGAAGKKAPATITDPGWTPLAGSRVLKKKLAHFKLRTEGAEFRFIVVWIVKAPPASQGTATAPGHVALSEVALYPPAS